MPNHLSVLGIIHTAISIFAILFALICLARNGKIDSTKTAGRLYIFFTIVTCITALPIMKTGHATGGHYLAILIMILLFIGIYAKELEIFGKLTAYAQVVILSATVFFSFIPTIIETLTRVPISHPIASGPNDPTIQMGLLTLVVLFVLGVAYQVVKLYRKKRTMPTTDNALKLS